MRRHAHGIIGPPRDALATRRLEKLATLWSCAVAMFMLTLQAPACSIEGSQQFPAKAAPQTVAGRSAPPRAYRPPSEKKYIDDCETPLDIYTRLQSASEETDFVESFNELYKDRWITENCWLLRVAQTTPDWVPRKKKWKLKLETRTDGLPVEAWSAQSLARWKPAQCAELQGKIVNITSLGSFTIDEAVLAKSESQRCDNQEAIIVTARETALSATDRRGRSKRGLRPSKDIRHEESIP